MRTGVPVAARLDSRYIIMKTKQGPPCWQHREPLGIEPVKEVHAVPEGYRAPSTLPTDPTHPQVVVVDDEPAIVDLVCDVLEDAELVADSCPHGRKAHACIRNKQPQVIILDIQMPGVDGIQLFHLLRADPSTQAIPVIFFTANAHVLRERLPDYQALGAELLPKPFHMDKLLDAVTRALAA